MTHDPHLTRITELTDQVVRLKALLRRAKSALNGVAHVDGCGICKEVIKAIEKEITN